LRCPDDISAIPGTAYLSYTVNGGFSLWHFTGQSFYAGDPGQSVAPGYTTVTFPQMPADLQRSGVMFLGTNAGIYPWDYKTTPAAITDGMSTTYLLAENTMAGYSQGTGFVQNLGITNWACPHPQYTMFIGSPHVCATAGAIGSTVTCPYSTSVPPAANVATFPVTEYLGWQEANHRIKGNYDFINYAQTLSTKGSSPFISSGHPNGSVKFVSSTIDSLVHSKLITPAGSKLSGPVRQGPVSGDVIGIQ
jgi:hypothetical protein